jgi:hypothetical protein
MTRLLRVEMLKLSSTRTFYALPGGGLARPSGSEGSRALHQ